nr:lysine--tRNA ligase [uncultured Actinomyces sp.]
MTDSSSTPTQAPADDTPEQVKVRAAKRARLMEAGIPAYPVLLPITTTIKKVREKYAHLEAGEETEDYVGLAGRVILARNGGKLCFATLMDGEGNKIQVMLSAASVGAESLAAYKNDVDLGDHLFVHGRVISSRRGELSIFAAPAEVTPEAQAAYEAASAALPAPDASWAIASKALRPLPKTWTTEDGEEVTLSEDQRIRRRELDLITRPAARDMVRIRAAVNRSIRENFFRRDYIELETPMLQMIHGGAAARPFITHMNALDTDLYLRIATEIYLKRAVVGGVDRVFEMNRNFRNEGMDSSHSPEFTSLEAYEAYSDYNGMADLTRDLIQQAARDAFDLSEGEEIVRLSDGTEYDLSGQWDRIDLYGSTSEALGEEVTVETPRETLVKYAERIGLEVDDYAVSGKIVEDIFEELVASKLWAPTFVYDFPEDTSPLTRYHRSRPGLTEKWDLYVRGFETGTAYSELADPVVQRERFEAQALAAANGDPEAMVMDEDFLIAMEQGFPPCGGMGMGIDRLLMVLTGQGIRETIPFPLVKRLG